MDTARETDKEKILELLDELSRLFNGLIRSRRT
jgi:hypothetical protein